MELSPENEYYLFQLLIVCLQWYIALTLVYSVRILYDIFRQLCSEKTRTRMVGQHYYDDIHE